ncbi:MAG: response regulator [Chloroflexi bacterium]|nr:response regulator [Chloroflexota bacterium]
MRKSVIAIVDDHEEVRESFADSLLKEGYEFLLFSNGKALLSYQTGPMPDVILLDVMMPDMDGFTVCKLLKAQDKWRHIPIILITALNTHDYIVRGLEAGAEEYLVKPVNTVELRARVRSMLRIKQQHDELQEILSQRERLANMIVHDMRQPINVALMRGYLVEQNTKLSEPDRKNIKIIASQLRRLESLANDILMAAKMHQGKFIIQLKEVDLKQMILNANPDYMFQAEAVNIELSLELPDQACVLMLDKNLILRVLDNLLTNALKFSPAESQVKIRLTRLAEDQSPLRARLEVIDGGPGVPLEYQNFIFDEFEIIEMRGKRGPQIGLGLAYCKMAVEAHNGAIYVKPNQPQGSIFAVDL